MSSLVAGIFVVAMARAADAPLFLSPTSIEVGSGLPTALLTPDLNGDGRNDLVITHYNTFQITPLLNNGDGTLTVLPASDTGGQPLGAVSDMIDSDEFPDVVLVELESDNAWFVRGRGDGTFENARGPINVGHDPLVVSGGDFNEDGHFDLAVARSPEGGGFLTVLPGNGDGTFGEPLLDEKLKDVGLAVLVGDVNGDRHADLLGSYTQTSIALFLGRGDGTFGDPQEITTGSRTPIIRVIDLNHDDKLDLFLVLTNQDKLATLLGRGDGTFEAPTYYAAGESPAYIALADVNHDGDIDAVVESVVSFDVRTMFGDGAGGFGTPRSYAAVGMAQLVNTLDLDGDGAPEVVAATAPQGVASLSIFAVTADGSLGAADNLIGGAAVVAAVSTDANDDAIADLVVAMPSATRVAAFISDPGQGYGPPVLSDPLAFPVARLAAGDYDGDEIADVVAASGLTQAAALLHGNGDGSFTTVAPLPLSTASGVLAALASDIDRDGHLDAILVQANGSVAVFAGHGDGLFDAPVVTAGIPSTVAPVLGDFTGDGNDDLATFEARQSRITILVGDGTGAFATGPTLAATRQVTGLAASDFDLDGKDDLSFLDVVGAQVGIALNTGGGQFAAPIFVSTGKPQATFAARDLSGDARPDLVVSVQEDGIIHQLTNDGMFTPAATAGTGQKPIATYSADFNGDGRYDVATINDTTGTVATVVSNIGGNHTARGDANGDGIRSAADLTVLVHKLSEGESKRVDTAGRGFAATVGSDANGDGVISRPDLRAMALRVFE